MPSLPERLGIVSRETFGRLEIFADLLGRWNAKINLVSPHDMGQLKSRHIDDCLQIVPLLPPAGDILDLGSGAGFPGLVIAMATSRSVTLVEADQRKAAFLREAARLTSTPVTIMAQRIETLAIRDAAIITARALAPLDRLLDLSAPLLGPDGVCLFLKGAQVDIELTAAEQRWQMDVVRHPAARGSNGCILEVRHPRPVDRTTG